MFLVQPSVIGDGALLGTWLLMILLLMFVPSWKAMVGVILAVSKFLDNSGIFFILTCFKFVIAFVSDGTCENCCRPHKRYTGFDAFR